MSTGQRFSGGRGQSSKTIPEAIDRYRVLGRIGGGAQGTVYLALDPLLDRKVAIKELISTDHGSEFAERFTLEARTLAKLNAPNIVQIYDFNPSWPYLVMEYCGDGDLNELIKGCRPRPLVRTVQLIRQICRALVVAHENETPILHRDLKPANVLFQGDVPKVTDFGLAKVLGAESTGLTKTDMPMGTIGYCSPEQLDDAASVDHRTDLWAVGVILYELLTFHTPFEKDGDLVGTMKRVLLDPPGAPRYELPPALWQFIERALSKKRDARFASAREMIQVLDQVLASVPGADQLILPPEDVLEDAERLASQVADSLGSGSTEQAKKWVDELRRISPDHSLTRYWTRRLRDVSDVGVPTPSDAGVSGAPTSDDLIARIETHTERYEYDEARRLCGKALIEDPANTVVQDLLQRINSRERGLAEELKRARQEAKARMLEGESAEVVAVWERLEQQFPRHPDIHAELTAARHAFDAERRRRRWQETEQRALELKQAGNLDEAVRLLDEFLGEFPENSGASDLRGVIRRELAHVAQKERLQQLRGEARALYEAGKLRRARAQWMRILEEVPTDEEAHREAERIRREVAEIERRERLVEARARASGLADSGDLPAAVGVWRAFLGEHPGDTEGTRELEALERRAEEQQRATLIAALRREADLGEARLAAGRYDSVESARKGLHDAVAEARSALQSESTTLMNEARERVVASRADAEEQVLRALDERRRHLRERLAGAEDLLPSAGTGSEVTATERALATAVNDALGLLGRAFPAETPSDPIAALDSATRTLAAAVEDEARQREEATDTARACAAEAIGAAGAALQRLREVAGIVGGETDETARILVGRYEELERAAGSPSAERLALVEDSARALAHQAEAGASAAVWTTARELESLFESAIRLVRPEERTLRALMERVARILQDTPERDTDPRELAGLRDELRAEVEACQGRSRDGVAAAAQGWQDALAATADLKLDPGSETARELRELRDAGEAAVGAARLPELERRTRQLQALGRRASLERVWAAHQAAVRRVEGPVDRDGVGAGPEDAGARETLARYRAAVARGASRELTGLGEELAALRTSGAAEQEVDGAAVVPPGRRVLKFNERYHPAAVERFDREREAFERASDEGDRAAIAQHLDRLRKARSALIQPPPLWPRVVAAAVPVVLLSVVAFAVVRPAPTRTELTLVSPLGEVRIESVTRNGAPVEGIPAEQLLVTPGGVSWAVESGDYTVRTEHGVELRFQAPRSEVVFVPAQAAPGTEALIEELGLDTLLEEKQ